MADRLQKQTKQQVVATRALIETSEKTRLRFVNTELDLSRTLAEKASASFQAGDLENATVAASAARLGYQTACKFLRKLTVSPRQRELLEAKRAKLALVIRKLRAIR